jgi:hypothetical protein
MGRPRRRLTPACGALIVAVVAMAACNSSRDQPEGEPAATVVVDLPAPTADIEPDGELVPGSGDPVSTESETSASETSASETSASETTASDDDPAGSETSTDTAAPSLSVPFADYFDVDPFGTEPVRGSGCGLDTFIGEELPDGLWRGYVRSFNGLWVDAATSLEFDLACVYTGDAAAEAEREWRAEHPGTEPTEVRDGFLVNNNDRVRTVPLASSFVQVDAQWNDAGQCAVPETLPPSGETQTYRLLDSWVLMTAGKAQWVVTSCLPR